MLKTLFETAIKDSPCGYIRTLMQQGYEHINQTSNTFASCLTKQDSDDVIVVTLDTDWAQSFYEYCAANPDNPFLPTVHEIDVHDGFCVARVEKLIASDHRHISDTDRDILANHVPQWISYIGAEADMPLQDEARAVLDKTIHDLLVLSQDLFKRSKGRILAYCAPALNDVFMRPNGQFVYGDPFFPGNGRDVGNLNFMNTVYKRFGLPDLTPVPFSLDKAA